ncbi:MAG TPA: mechanosensitive ion channel, partial [Pirellulaceae bacterium]|nr:mechanosensitive ion channel [Pirellulaceae bacterium]
RTLNAARDAVIELRRLENERRAFERVLASHAPDDEALARRLQELESEYPVPDSGADVATLQARLTQFKNERDSIQESLATTRRRLSEMARRSTVLSSDLMAARQTVKSETVEVARGVESDSMLRRARSLFQDIAGARDRTRVELLEMELLTLPIRTAHEEARIKVDTETLVVLTRSIDIIRSKLHQSDLQKMRRLAAEIGEKMDRSMTAQSREESAKNLALANDLVALAENYYADEAQVTVTDSQIADVDRSLRLIDRIVAAGRADGDLGSILRRVRTELPSAGILKRDIASVQSRQIKRQLDAILWQDALDAIDSSTESASTRAGESELAERKSVLTSLLAMVGRYDSTLTSLRVKLESLQLKTASLRRALDGRLLWLPTNEVLNKAWVAQTVAASAEMLDVNRWRRVVADFLQGAMARPGAALALYLSALGLLFYRSQLRMRLAALAAKVSNVRHDAYWVSPLAILLTAASVAAVPLLLGTTGWLLSDAAATFSMAVGAALIATANVWLILGFFRALARRGGVIQAHFGWDDGPRATLAANFAWLMTVIIPCTFIFTYAMSINEPNSQYGLGRSIFLVISVALASAGFRMLRPGQDVGKHMFGHFQSHFLERLAFLIFALIPLALGILTLGGFFDTSVILQSKIFASGLLLLGSAVFYGVLQRTYNVSARRRALARALAKRRSNRIKLVEGAPDRSVGDNLPQYREEEIDDINAVNKEAETVVWLATIVAIASGLYLIWRSTWPALDIADSLVLWQGVQIIDGVSTYQPVSAGDLIVAVAVIFGGFFLARNLRGVLALGIARKVRMRPGARYAATTIVGYVLVAAGLLFGLSRLGLDWSKLQWVVAALGVGLGFGLQEIVANFVSGLIILFERPIRVGDVVTIGTLDGTVSKIAIRATTITDFEKREVLIPNRVLITDNVTNWTLNDSVTRLLIEIGLGYETDVAKATQLMKDVVTSIPDVLATPEPSVYFAGHGESTLNFEIRAFVASVSKRLATRHAINDGIHNALTSAKINIAFPQRDIHIIADRNSSQENAHAR